MTNTRGKLILVPSPLSFGVALDETDSDLRNALPWAVIETAARLSHWVAENAKTTRAFLKRVHELKPLSQASQTLSIQELPRAPKGQPVNSHSELNARLTELLSPAFEGIDVGLISEAGLPAVADPGAALVAAAHQAEVIVQPLAGPSSLMLALAASGLNGQCFAFVGYLPTDSNARSARIRELEGASKRWSQTQLIIETPYRNTPLWEALVTHLSAQTRLSVSCGLTLPGGWTRSMRVRDWRTLSSSKPPNNVPTVFAFQA